MRKIKTIKVDALEVTVKELTVDQILGLFDEAGDSGGTVSDLANLLQGKLSLVTDLEMDVARKMAPSELRQVWDAVREVNADFFRPRPVDGTGRDAAEDPGRAEERSYVGFIGAVCTLIEAGHGAAVYGYGIGFFNRALAAHRRNRKQFIVDKAAAANLAHAKKHDVERFLNAGDQQQQPNIRTAYPRARRRKRNPETDRGTPQ